MDPNAEPLEIEKAGEKMLIALYKGNDAQSLDELRYIAYGRSMTKSKFNLACLPPTTAAAREHSFRTFHQVQTWMGYVMPAESWGWKQTANGLMPVTTVKDAAPQELLKFLTCKCSQGCGNRCGCRKGGLKCSEACYCNGQSCSNAKAIEHFANDEDEESTIEMDLWLSQNDKYGQPMDTFLDAGEKNLPSDDDWLQEDEDSTEKEDEEDEALTSGEPAQEVDDDPTDTFEPSSSKKPRRA